MPRGSNYQHALLRGDKLHYHNIDAGPLQVFPREDQLFGHIWY